MTSLHRECNSSLDPHGLPGPIWTFHGSADTVVPTDFTREIFAKMKQLGGNMKYTELRGVGHGANAIAFQYTGDDATKGHITQYASDRPDKTGDIWEWLFRQKLRPTASVGSPSTSSLR